MNTIEQDAERVRAVHAALEGPMTVWVVRYSGLHDEGFSLHRTEASAQVQLAAYLDDEWESCRMSKKEYKTERKKILAGLSKGFDDSDRRWYSIDTEIVNP